MTMCPCTACLSLPQVLSPDSLASSFSHSPSSGINCSVPDYTVALNGCTLRNLLRAEYKVMNYPFVYKSILLILLYIKYKGQKENSLSTMDTCKQVALRTDWRNAWEALTYPKDLGMLATSVLLKVQRRNNSTKRKRVPLPSLCLFLTCDLPPTFKPFHFC